MCMTDSNEEKKLFDSNSSDLDSASSVSAEVSSGFDSPVGSEEVLGENTKESSLSGLELSEKNFNDLMKKFRSQSAGIISEFRRKSAYIPESVRRAEKQAKARSRNKKKLK